MELTDILLASLPIAFFIGLNIRTYKDTKEWLATHSVISILWNEEIYRKLKRESIRGFLEYYFGMPGRKIAYFTRFKN